ncbi:hypothetical protein AOQ73_11995 [Bradyrhizobium pachyrhizi]|uniref:hypothetical protein n=1 Tax=Bradyrhizobium pachyrhizi TaxID=280333 RepID=UPI0007054E25|nr:hypothetical protein [Bradyrhizobium pachyrhizi]KRQ08734.1 hypothetical protein AOQ73_11995 [Bradyrhizobium pachyrhizi]
MVDTSRLNDGAPFVIPMVVNIRILSGTDAWPAGVAIRTEDKGVVELPFSKFKVAQIDCLMRHWDEIRHLSEVDQSCFGRLLCEPEGGWGEKDLRARDA